MKALSLWQPWAEAMCSRLKKFETRHWATSYRGPLAIHAAKKNFNPTDYDPVFVAQLREDGLLTEGALTYGAIICIVRLTGIHRTEDIRYRITERELRYGDYSDGRFAWETEFMQVVKSEPCIGHQGLFNWWPATVPPASLSLPVQERDT